MFALEVRQILGTPNRLAWSQVHHFSPQEEEKKDKRGELVLLASLKLDSKLDLDASAVGREIISRIYEEYFGSLESKPMDQLKESFLKVGQEKLQYFKSPENLSLVALVFWKDIVYIAVWSSGSVLLRRNSKTVTLVNGDKSEVKLASGFFKIDDLFFVATSDFLEKIPQTMIKASLSTEDSEVIVDVLAPVVYAKEKQGNIAAAVVRPRQIKSKKIKSNKRLAKILDLTKLQNVFKTKNRIVNRLLNIPKKLLLGIFAKKRQATVTLGVGFLLLLAVSMFFGWKKQTEKRRENQILSLSSQIEEKIQAAAAIKNLDPESSLEIIRQTEEDMVSLRKISLAKYNVFQERIDNLISNLGTEEVTPDLFYDLNLIAEGVKIYDLAYADEQVVILDQTNPRLIRINLTNKSGKIQAAGDEFKNQKLLSFSSDRIFFVSDKAISLLNKDNKLEEIKELDLGAPPVDAGGWLGNLYLLDSEQIWKYPAIASGVGSKRAWLVSEVDLSQAVSMDIDGTIWLLLTTGRFYNFVSGIKQEIDLNLPSGIGSADFLSVAQQGETVAFWDKDNKTAWVFNKTGQFIARIPIKIDNLTGLKVSSSGDRLYLFGQDKIFSLSL